LAECCLPWEGAFERLISRLLPLAATPRVQREEARAAAIFWKTDKPIRSGKGHRAAENVRFLEWLLQDRPAGAGDGPLLGEYADEVADLSRQEEDLLFALLLAPVRVHEVAETLGLRGFLVKDLLTGAERLVAPFGFGTLPIRSDVVVCRLVPVGRSTRAGAGVLVLPGSVREDLLAYLRTAYRISRPPRHVSLEDFLDGSTHLYHHFFLDRGRELGGRAQETVRSVSFAPARAIYRTTDCSRICVGLERQPQFHRDAGVAAGLRCSWIDPDWGLTRATVVVNPSEVRVDADTREDLAQCRSVLETCLRGLIEPAGESAGQPPIPRAFTHQPSRLGLPGQAFFARIVDRWTETASPLLGGRTPAEACRSQAGRQQVAALVLGMERECARLRRLGRAWVDLRSLREQLDLPLGADR